MCRLLGALPRLSGACHFVAPKFGLDGCTYPVSGVAAFRPGLETYRIRKVNFFSRYQNHRMKIKMERNPLAGVRKKNRFEDCHLSTYNQIVTGLIIGLDFSSTSIKIRLL